MKYTMIYSDYFCGNRVSEYGKENGFLDYGTFSKGFDAVLNNDIMQETEKAGFYWDIENGITDNYDEIQEKKEQLEDIEDKLCEMIDEDKENTEEYKALEEQKNELENEIEDLEYEDGTINEDIFQYYIVSDSGAQLIKDYTNDPLFYCAELDMYIWGVTHYGTAWNHVLTDVKINAGEKAFEEIENRYNDEK